VADGDDGDCGDGGGDWEAVVVVVVPVALMGPALSSGTPTPHPPRSNRLPALAPTWTAAFRTRCV